MSNLPTHRSCSPAPRRRSGALRSAPLAIAVASVLALLGTSAAGAAEAPVGLGTASSFAVLAGAGITNTGATTITGDVGTFPTTAETGFGTVVQTGVDHGGDAIAQQAKIDLVTAFGDAAGRGPVTAAVPVDLAGEVLTPGVYSGGTIELSGALTLDAQGDADAVFVFQADSTLVTASASTVTIVNGGPTSACNIFWKVGSSATLGSGSSFVGTVLAQESISLDSSAVIEGRLLARTGAVTMINNTITNTGCPVVPVSTPTTTTAPTTTAPATTAAPTTAATQATTPTPTDGGPPAGGGTTAGSTGRPTGPPPTDTALAFTGSNGDLVALGLAMVTAGIVLAATSRPRRRRA